jgi:SP family sugar:H+ symporter-like MFS transporter
MGLATATNWTFNFLIGFFTTSITEMIGFDLGWTFAASIILGALFVYFCVHETQGKSLEEIDREISSGVKPWQSKKGQ